MARRRRAAATLRDGRVRLLACIVLVGLLVIVGKATLLAATSHDLSDIATSQQTATIDLAAHRGSILDRTGKQLAVGRELRTVCADPRQIKDPDKAARRLAAVLKVKVGPLRKALSDSDSGFAYVARRIEPALARKALKLDITGVYSYSEEARVYPMKRLAAQVLGYAGTENKGLAGLELLFDEELTGRMGSQKVVQDPNGNILSTERVKASVDGESVRLTIDADIQYEAESILAATVRKYYAKAGEALVMDPDDGSILAMANAPLIDANKYGENAAYTRNRLVTDVFEPGSIFKAVTVAAALEEGLVTPDTTFRLAPTLVVGDKTIHEAHPRGTEDFSVRRILVESSNVGAGTLGLKLGHKQMEKWIKAFGFGKKTGVEYPGEVAGIMPGYWSLATLGNVPMGQGISTTALQMAQAYCALANGGVLMKPRLVAQIGDEVQTPDTGRRVVSEKTAAQMMDMMTDVVDSEAGTGTNAQIEGYKVAGKTGTAQKVVAGQAGYAEGRYVASFMLLVPADDPQLLVMVVVDEPHPIYGGTVAAPAARDIAEFALTHLKIAP